MIPYPLRSLLRAASNLVFAPALILVELRGIAESLEGILQHRLASDQTAAKLAAVEEALEDVYTPCRPRRRECRRRY